MIVIDFIRAWFWLGMGELFARILESNDDDEAHCDKWYPRYNYSMCKSSEAQGQRSGTLWPWGPVQK